MTTLEPTQASSDLTATKRFRELLDESGVEWVGTDFTEPTNGHATNTSLGSEHHDAVFIEYTDGSVLRLFDLTPEQAIAATLGRGTLSAGQVSNAVYAHSIHADCADADWQAIADELNATLVRPTCHNIKADWPSLFECDECGYSNDDTFHGSKCNFKFCPNCGAKVVDK